MAIKRQLFELDLGCNLKYWMLKIHILYVSLFVKPTCHVSGSGNTFIICQDRVVMLLIYTEFLHLSLLKTVICIIYAFHFFILVAALIPLSSFACCFVFNGSFKSFFCKAEELKHLTRISFKWFLNKTKWHNTWKYMTT